MHILRHNEVALFCKLQKRHFAQTKRAEKLACAYLKKESVNDEEVAFFMQKSISSFRALKIQEAYQKIGQFDESLIAQDLGITQDTLFEWMASSETEVWLKQCVTELGGDFFLDAIPPVFSKQGALTVFLGECLQNAALFCAPLQILKVYRIKQNLALAKNVSQDDVLGNSALCEQLILRMIEQLFLERKAALISLMQASSTPFELRQMIYAHIFCEVRTDKAATRDAVLIKHPFFGKTEEVRILEIREAAKETKKVLQLLTSGHEFQNLKNRLSRNICLFLEHFVAKESFLEAVQIIQNKIENVIARQNKRLALLALGQRVSLPCYFHATRDIETLFVMSTSGIRPSQGSSWYGAFISTFPASFRYGNVLLGFDERAAFESRIGIGNDGGVGKTMRPLFIPDGRKYVNWQILKEATHEKWIGFEGVVYSNYKAKETKSHFFQALSSALKVLYEKFCAVSGTCQQLEELYAFEAQLLAKLDAQHIYFFLTQESSWKAQLEHVGMQKNSNYVALDANELQLLFKSISTCPQFASYLQEAEAFCEFTKEMKRYFLVTQQKAFSSDGTFEISDASLSDRPFFIAVDDEKLLLEYFNDKTKWPRKVIQNKTHTVDEVKRAYRASFSKYWKSAALEIFLATHIIPMMEQLIEFDYTMQYGVQILKNWIE